MCGETSFSPVTSTAGLSVLSKNLKTFLRKHKPEIHLHFDPANVPVDTFLTNPSIIKAPIQKCLEKLTGGDRSRAFLNDWKKFESSANSAIEEYILSAAFSEAKAMHYILSRLPEHINLHLSNSMPVRYADLFDVKAKLLCRSNRGTSGIDGCTSTALGSTLASQRLNILITGDLAFFYDQNAFFNNYGACNLKVIVMNNQGGGIFRLIEGPSQLPELEDYFETRHYRTARYICEENDYSYYPVKSDEELKREWNRFIGKSERISIMEVFSDPAVNQETYRELRTHINERINILEKSSRL